jgi:hypothetical protein
MIIEAIVSFMLLWHIANIGSHDPNQSIAHQSESRSDKIDIVGFEMIRGLVGR